MKLQSVLGVMIVALAFGAAAEAKTTVEIVLHNDCMIAGSHLASGTYGITWEGASPEATISFFRGKKLVVSAKGKLVDRGTRNNLNQVVYYDNADGTHLIQEIRLKGSSEVIEF